jgi:hypothetical protein
VVNPRRTSLLVQIIHVLRAEKQSVADRAFQIGEGLVSGVRLAADSLRSSLRVEAPNDLRVGGPALRRGDLFESVVLPEAARVAECADATLGADASSGQDEDLVGRADSQGGG